MGLLWVTLDLIRTSLLFLCYQ